MAYSKIASVSKAATGASSAIVTTGADLIVIGVSALFATPTPSDSKSNTWTGFTTIGSSGTTRTKLWYCQAPTVGSGHTFTVSTDFPAFFVLAFSGSVASPLDQQSGASSVTPGSITPVEDNELVVTLAGGSALSDPTSLTGGFTLEAHIAGDNATCEGGAIAWLVQTTAAAANPTWTITNSATPASTMGSFKAAAVATGWGGLLSDQRNRMVM